MRTCLCPQDWALRGCAWKPERVNKPCVSAMLPAAAALRWSGLFTYFPILSLFDTRLLLASNQTLLVLCLRVKIMGSLWAYSGETGQRDPQRTHRSCREPPPAPGEFAYFSITQSHLDTRDKNTPTAFGPCAKNNCHQY